MSGNMQFNNQNSEPRTAPAQFDACSTTKLVKVLTRDENELLFKLQTPSFGFIQRLQQGSNSPPMVQLLIKVIAKSCKSVHQTQLIDLLSKIQNSNFLKGDLLEYLNKFIAEDKKIEAEICSSTVTILRTLAILFPSKSLAIITFLCAPLQRILNSNTRDYDDANREFKKLQEETTDIRKELQSGTVQRDQERQEEWNVDEREDYRRMSVVPTSEDIRGQGDPHLRENKIYQPYKDAHDYLDVQFRLMKEDLVSPLREGLAELISSREEGNNRRTKSNMKVYSHVQITSVRCSQHGLIYKIQFDVSRLVHVLWEAGKRLMLGSLVCLSADKFRNMLIATIAERDVKDLCRGVTYLYIDEDDKRNADIRLDKIYDMIESPAYYEPYKCVLQALQAFTEEEGLPFEKYLLNKRGEEEVSPPKYLMKGVKYDFSALLHRARGMQSSLDYRRKLLLGSDSPNSDDRSGGIVTVLDLSTWPTADKLGLDASQYNALQTALTKEFAVVQGPPGTGKTFIGVQIVELMLENNKNRRTLGSGPIMLVCFTNHALDQFLEEIIRLYPNYVDAGLFVRIGGTCKSENKELKKCFLRHIKQSGICQEFRGATIEPRKNMEELEEEIMSLSAYTEIAVKELFHPEVLKPYMRHVEFKHVEHLLEWLCDRNAEPGTPNLLAVHENVFDIENQNYFGNQPDLEDEFEGLESLETEEREQNDNNLISAEKKFQAIAKSVWEKNFLKLHGQEDKRFTELFQAAQRIRSRFHEAFKESDNIISVKNKWRLTVADRWRLYNYWVKSFIAAQRLEMQTLLNDHAQEKRKIDEVRDEIDYTIFSRAKIIAMTTTGAAKRSHMLKRLAPKIVIVEEAAEVLEAHVVASLSEKCEHLILIGDHQQLKPKPADYNLAKRFRLDISLFEKVVLNKLHCDRLTIQHRMRPEIAELLVPHIYKSLENHESVLSYENVANVFGNLFFVNHSQSENSTDDNRSHSNDHEATFISELCRYLLNVGYEPKQITVLTTYTGQFFLLRNLMPKSEFDGVRITPVDNFQGEENDIILLSLVRSNDESKIGFLSVSNRICVALSRARKGLYIIGNSNLLRDESPLWRDILDTLKKQNKLVDSLPLGCHKHEIVNYVKASADFGNVPQSGCDHPCHYRLSCGHVCVKRCHELDAEHEHYKCKKPCQRLCANNMHPCRKLCFENCDNCPELVERTLSRCGHQATMCCYLKEEDFKCEQPCKLECSAGHLCQQVCYEKCKCQIPVRKTLTRCQHEATMPCHLDELKYECTEPCKKVCPSDHPCNRLCFEHCGLCKILVIKTLSACKHTIEMPCYFPEKWFKCKERCTKSCSSDHACQKLCHEVCGNCMLPVTKILPACKHETIMPCYMEASTYLNENLCSADVEITLPLCGHIVIRSCFASKIPFKCSEPCKKSCSYGHRCKRKCHEPCGDCEVMVEKVLPRCEHKAMMPCHQRADSHVCQIKCNRVFPCGHSCPDLCHMKCDDCQVSVEKVLPSCGHKAIMPCHREPRKHRCELPCERKCPEGHLCPKICGADCGICISKREMTFTPCNHVNMIECFLSPNQVICKSSCEKFLLCGHKCQEICGAMTCTITCKVKVEKELPCKHIARTYCYLDLSSLECHQEIEKILPCGHVDLLECHQDPITFVCQEHVEKKLPCGHVATMTCFKDPSTYPCLQKVNVKICEFGHTQEIKCCETVTLAGSEIDVERRPPIKTYRNGCPKICDFKLDCGHGCTRKCRECAANKSHAKCNQTFSKPFSLCPHQSLCVSPLSPCGDFSSYTCFHRKDTSYRCIESFEICLRSCFWSCAHYTCTTVCSQPCNRPPCSHPCQKALKCGHVCSGLCGELCLSACLKCNNTSFTERTWPTADCITTKESRFLELRPCLHLVEVVSMDVWVQENVQQLPGNLDSSCFLRCPLCSEKVDFCPRYNQYIRRHELSLIAAKELIKASENLKRTIDDYLNLWLRNQQYNPEMKEKLTQLGVAERIKLGTLSILHEIEVVESQRKNSNSTEKCKVRLSGIRQCITEDLYFEDKPRLAGDVLTMYRLYMDVQVRRLMAFVRGPNLKVLDECSGILDELDGIEVTEDNFQNIWTRIEKLNRKLSTKLSPLDRKDQITDYVDHLNRFYDLQLAATFLTHWACCRRGHVYSTKEKLDKDKIDESCPQCHPLHNVILCFLKPDFDETAVIAAIDTSAYYKRSAIPAMKSHRKWADYTESEIVAEFVPGEDAGMSGVENNSEVTHSDLKAGTTPRSVPGTLEKKIVSEWSFRGGHSGRKGKTGKTSWARLNLEDFSDRPQQQSQTRSQPRSSETAQHSVDSPRQTFRGKDRCHGDRTSYDSWRTRDRSQSGRATSSAFSESSYTQHGTSISNVQQSRSLVSWSVSKDEKDQENLRAPADRINVQRSTTRGGRYGRPPRRGESRLQ